MIIKVVLINVVLIEGLLYYLDLYSNGNTDPLGMFPLFLKLTADILASHRAVVFLQILRLSSFPVCWRVASVTTNPKGHPFS